MNIEFDPTNPLDVEIQKRIQVYKYRPPYWHEETVIQRILHKRLASNQYSCRKRKNRINEAIEIGIKRRQSKTGMSRENVIREAFCLHFDIPFYAN